MKMITSIGMIGAVMIFIIAGMNMVATTNADGSERRGNHCSGGGRGPDTGHEGAASTVRPCGNRTCRYCHVELLGADAPYLTQMSRGAESPLELYIEPQRDEAPMWEAESRLIEVVAERAAQRTQIALQAAHIQRLKDKAANRRGYGGAVNVNRSADLLERYVEPAVLISMMMDDDWNEDEADTGQASLDDVI